MRIRRWIKKAVKKEATKHISYTVTIDDSAAVQAIYRLFQEGGYNEKRYDYGERESYQEWQELGVSDHLVKLLVVAINEYQLKQ